MGIRRPIALDPKTGECFKAVREFLGFNQIEMAEALGVSQSLVSYIERGHVDAPLSLVRTLCIKYKISPDYFIYFEGSISKEYAQKKLSLPKMRDISATIEDLQERVKVLEDKNK